MQEKEVRMLEECELTSALLKSGLHSLRRAGMGEKGIYYRAFFELSIAIERVLKIIIIMRYRRENEGAFPTVNAENVVGHKLIELWRKAGIKELTGIHQKILVFLDEFAGYTRYYNLDYIFEKQGKNKNHGSVLSEWKGIQELISKKHGEKRYLHKEEMSDMLAQNCKVLFYGMEGDALTQIDYLLDVAANADYIQGYSVLYVFEIIKELREKICELEKHGYYMPVVSEFFSYYTNHRTNSEIRRKKDWLGI
ncbi:MAG: hypothetical protein K5641_07665 [Lachnospiraceae bacterium]|nr:hypothetical protein [Lachnospiraceae bacterium]